MPDNSDRHIEIACDESGFTGSNLVAPATVFAHASVRIERGRADLLMRRLRLAARAPDGELKANRILRPRYRHLLPELLGPDGELRYDARVHLTDCRLFVLARVVDVLLGSGEVRGIDLPGRDDVTRTIALTLSAGEAAFGSARWQDFLVRAGSLLRFNRRVPPNVVQEFMSAVEGLRLLSAPPEVRDALARLVSAPARAEAELARATPGPHSKRTPLLEPLLPALARAVIWWGAAADRITVIHDEQSALTRHRIADMAGALAAAYPGHRLVVIRVDSRTDPRVQVADLIAGVARRAAGSLLIGRPETELLDLIRPVVDPASLWPDASIWDPESDGARRPNQPTLSRHR
jgi:hypothetical protein